jgi:hypothetical protein
MVLVGTVAVPSRPWIELFERNFDRLFLHDL